MAEAENRSSSDRTVMSFKVELAAGAVVLPWIDASA